MVGALLGIVFGASSLYLVLKVGMTVSASIPVAVLSITLFRVFSKSFGFRNATILENNIVQTTGSAGESIAFGVGVTMPAVMLLGFEMDITRVMVGLGAGRRAGHPDDDPAAPGVHRQAARHADLSRGHGLRRGARSSARRAARPPRRCSSASASPSVYKFLAGACKLWSDEPSQLLYRQAADGTTHGLQGAAISGDLAPELLGVGYIIGPRIASLMWPAACCPTSCSAR